MSFTLLEHNVRQIESEDVFNVCGDIDNNFITLIGLFWFCFGALIEKKSYWISKLEASPRLAMRQLKRKFSFLSFICRFLSVFRPNSEEITTQMFFSETRIYAAAGVKSTRGRTTTIFTLCYRFFSVPIIATRKLCNQSRQTRLRLEAENSRVIL